MSFGGTNEQHLIEYRKLAEIGQGGQIAGESFGATVATDGGLAAGACGGAGGRSGIGGTGACGSVG